MELFEVSLLGAPVGVVLAIAAALRFRSGWPLLAVPVGALIGGVLGRWFWEWFAMKHEGVDFGSEFEGYDWVMGFAAVGVLVAVAAASVVTARRASARR